MAGQTFLATNKNRDKVVQELWLIMLERCCVLTSKNKDYVQELWLLVLFRLFLTNKKIYQVELWFMVMARLFLTNKNRDHVQELLIVVLARD